MQKLERFLTYGIHYRENEGHGLKFDQQNTILIMIKTLWETNHRGSVPLPEGAIRRRCRVIYKRVVWYISNSTLARAIATLSSFCAEARRILDLCGLPYRENKGHGLKFDQLNTILIMIKNSLENKSSRHCDPARECDAQKMQGDIQMSLLIYIYIYLIQRWRMP